MIAKRRICVCIALVAKQMFDVQRIANRRTGKFACVARDAMQMICQARMQCD